MTASELADCLIATLPSGISNLFNPWVDICPNDRPENGPREKIARLAQHLDCEPRFILCGEAPGYQGCRHTGVAFTSERLLLEGQIPRVTKPTHRLTNRINPYSEPSATIVWKTLKNLGISEEVILWNSVQLHPNMLGESESNRTPTISEVEYGISGINILVNSFPLAKIIAVGRKAEHLLNLMNVEVLGSVRHPANGGASKFKDGIIRLTKMPARLKN